MIGRGGDMIKKIQADTGCRVQFHQERDDGPGDKRYTSRFVCDERGENTIVTIPPTWGLESNSSYCPMTI